MIARVAVEVRGVVQGVGFRPFVYVVARSLGITGWVRNAHGCVRLEAQGTPEALARLVAALRRDHPPAASVEEVAVVEQRAVAAEAAFVIAESDRRGAPLPVLPPDLAICAACAAEIAAPDGRRARYPFTTCTRCGPRYTIVEALPYDRARTAMARFALCPPCRAEYEEPTDRRFHAEPIACPACGPRLRLVVPNGPDGALLAEGEAALAGAAAALSVNQKIIGLKGLGGYQLLVDACDEAAVARLRARKRREEKPFAVMFPSIEALRAHAALSPDDERALRSPEAPIVLVRRRRAARLPLAPGIAPGANPWVGAMLPYTPLHALLLHAVGRPLVCTSGNFSDEPICTDDGEALRSLSGVADLLLTHDRPIVRPVDDSVARVGPRGLEVLRRARGFAPRPLPFPDGPPLVALGAQLKGTVTLALRGRAVVSQHLGDLHSARGARLLERTARELVRLFDVRPALVACDLHPDYASTRLAERLALEWEAPLVRVQHHHAHVAAVMAEHAVAGPVLGLAWDGAGLGTDGELWGGEALSCDGARAVRVAHLRPFSLPGGERAIREPRRAAFGALFAIDKIDRAPFVSDGERALFATAIARGVNAPRTTSVGRLFDAVAALVGLRARAGYEGQAAMELEWAADAAGAEAGAYELPLTNAASSGDGDGDGAAVVGDWEPLVLAILDDRARGVPPGVIAARFHGALVEYARACARRAGLPRVVLSGGCFQNARLSRLVRAALEDDGFEVLAPRRYPPNDGAVSLGQALVAAASWTAREGDDVSRRTR